MTWDTARAFGARDITVTPPLTGEVAAGKHGQSESIVWPVRGGGGSAKRVGGLVEGLLARVNVHQGPQWVQRESPGAARPAWVCPY